MWLRCGRRGIVVRPVGIRRRRCGYRSGHALGMGDMVNTFGSLVLPFQQRRWHDVGRDDKNGGPTKTREGHSGGRVSLRLWGDVDLVCPFDLLSADPWLRYLHGYELCEWRP